MALYLRGVIIMRMGVEFDEHQPLGYNYHPVSRGGITGIFIKLGLAKDEAGSQKVMLTITFICFALSFYFFYKALF
jgi:hypothetical protein